jgi:hypothetical protein
MRRICSAYLAHVCCRAIFKAGCATSHASVRWRTETSRYPMLFLCLMKNRDCQGEVLREC